MIVICPGCSRKYNIKDESIKSEKKVKCTLCGTIWIVKKRVEPEIEREPDQVQQDPVSTFINKHTTSESEDLLKKIPQINDHKKDFKFNLSYKFIILAFLISFASVSTFAILFPEHIPFINNNQIKVLKKTNDYLNHKLSEMTQFIERTVFNKKLSIKNVSYKLKDNSLIIYGEINNSTRREMKIPDLLISIIPKESLEKPEYMRYKLREKSIKANSAVKFTLKIGEIKHNSVDISIKLKNQK